MTYRRRIVLTSQPGRVEGELEDDFHHFRVTIEHDGERVTSCEGESVRFPWSTCATANGPLREVAGVALSARSTSVRGHTDPKLNCTHLFDLTGLAIAHAVRMPDGGTRVYEIAVPDRDRGRTRPTLARDGEPLLEWDVAGREIVGPSPYEGVALRGSFLDWAEATLPLDEAEAAIVMRRSCDIAMGREFDLDRYETAADLGPMMHGSCHAFQPDRVMLGRRMKGSTRS